MTDILHTADTHLVYHQYHQSERATDFRKAFSQVIDAAIDQDVDAVVHGGDLFHTTDQPADVHTFFQQEAERLAEAEIGFLAVGGNHERSTSGRDWVDFHDVAGHVTRLNDQPTTVGDVAFYGLDYVPRSFRDQLDYDFKTPPADTTTSVLVAHGQFRPLAPGDWELKEVLQKSSIPFDAVLLGDEHEHIISKVDDIPVTYPGSTERTAADQQEPRGYNLVSFDGDGVSINHPTLDTRPFEYIDPELDQDEGIQTVRTAIDRASIADAVAVINIYGDGEAVSLARVEEYAIEEGALYATASDKRDAEGETEQLDIEFTDPDEFVSDRVDDLGLTQAVTDVDSMVRNGKVPKSNIDSKVTEMLVERVQEEPEAFAVADESEPADDEEQTATDAETASEAEAGEGGEDTSPSPESHSTPSEPSNGGAESGAGQPSQPAEDSPEGGSDIASASTSNAESEPDENDSEEVTLGDFGKN